MSDVSSVIDRVRKLLALSHSDNIHEANAALQVANKLIEQYRLSQSELEISDGMCDDEPIVEDTKTLYESGRITKWKSVLAMTLAHHYGCSVWNRKSYRYNRYQLVGRTSDIEVVHYMFAWLAMEAERLSNNETKKHNHNRGDGKIFCASYCYGFAIGIREQLSASKAVAAKESTSQALVKLDARLAAAEAFMNKGRKLIKRSASNNSHINAGAYNSGKEHGKNMHIGSSLSGGTKLLGSG